MLGAMASVKWDFLPLEGSTDFAQEQINLASRFAREAFGIRPPFIPTLEGQTFEQFKLALTNPGSKNFLKKISEQWNQGNY